MTTARKSLLVAILILVPVVFWAMWLGSGREVFTKSGKATEVAVRDPLFGDVEMQVQFQRGPIGGYYIGLDLAALVTVVALIIGGLAWWLSGRHGRRQREAQVKRGPST